MKKLIVHRDLRTEFATLSKWELRAENNEIIFECFGCEPLGEPTIKSGLDKPILPGVYNASWFRRPSGKIVPILWNENVPLARLILIHTGNTDEDTAGCLLPGRRRDKKGVLQSRDAFNELMSFFSNPKPQNDENGLPVVVFKVEII